MFNFMAVCCGKLYSSRVCDVLCLLWMLFDSKKCEKDILLLCFTAIVNTFSVSVLTRAKLFKGKKVHGDYDIKVEQVGFNKAVISF